MTSVMVASLCVSSSLYPVAGVALADQSCAEPESQEFHITTTGSSTMADVVTKPTKASVKSFIAAVPNETRRKDAQTLLKLYERATGWKAQMWGPTIVGFGRYAYTYESGHSGESLVCGFSPRTGNLVIYGGPTDPRERAALLRKLGKHKTSVACVYINKLADVDERVLERFIEAGVAARKRACEVAAR
jgi:hypothetical protein